MEECRLKKSSIKKSLSEDVTTDWSTISALSRAVLLRAKFEQQGKSALPKNVLILDSLLIVLSVILKCLYQFS